MIKTTVVHYAKMVLYALGYATLLGMAYITCLTFYAIVNYGYFYAYEPDTSTLYTEVGATIYGVAFLLYLVLDFARNKLLKRR